MEPGTRVADRFLVEALAGRGGMATVYRAHDLETDTRVALKVLTALGADAAPRFAREARALSSRLVSLHLAFV